MSELSTIATTAAPAAIGPYSQAVRAGNTVYLSGQIPLVPETMTLVEGDISTQTRQVFNNLQAVAIAAGGSLANMAKVEIFLTDLNDFAAVNTVMQEFFQPPYPARACVEVAGLPKGAAVEIQAIMISP
ncbi:MAG: RidA family protein [Pseudomonadales bacterium]|nr:RidA family protein [Pseudomonadales bacterium]